MTISKQIAIGFKGYFKALELLFTKGFMKFMIFPLLLNIAIFWFGIEQISNLTTIARESFINWIDIANANFWGASFLQGALSGVITIIIYIIFFISFAIFGGYIILILLSPLFSIISEKTEKTLSKEDLNYPFNLKYFVNDILRGVGIALRNVLIEFGILILVFIIGLILSFISWAGAIFMFFVSAYFFGFSYMDYTNERDRLSIKESVSFMRKYKWVAIVNGSLFALILFIPYIGIALSAFVAIISVIAGAASMYEIKSFEDAKIDKNFDENIDSLY